MFFDSRRALHPLALIACLALPSYAQKDIEDLPILDVVPVPAKTVTSQATTAPKPTVAKAPASKANPIDAPAAIPTLVATKAPVAAKATPTTATTKPTTATALPITPKSADKTADIEDLPIPDVPGAPPVANGRLAPPLPTATSAPVAIATSLPGTTPTVPPVPVASDDHSHHEEQHRTAQRDPTATAPREPLANYLNLQHTFQYDFMRQALFAGLLVALMCSYLGVYVVLKRIVFVGVALAELSSAGIAFGLWLGFSPIIGAILLMLFGVTMFAVRWSPRRVPTESVIGIIYSVAGALAVLCIAKSAGGETHMLGLLQGNVLTVSSAETLEMLGIFSVVALIHILFGKEFLLVSFDRDAASTMGYNAVRWDFLLYLSIGIVISFSIRAVGVLMATTMLIIPAVSALLPAQRMKQVWPLALLFGVLPVVLGLHLSLLLDLPASAVIVALSFLMLLPIMTFVLRT